MSYKQDTLIEISCNADHPQQKEIAKYIRMAPDGKSVSYMKSQSDLLQKVS